MYLFFKTKTVFTSGSLIQINRSINSYQAPNSKQVCFTCISSLAIQMKFVNRPCSFYLVFFYVLKIQKLLINDIIIILSNFIRVYFILTSHIILYEYIENKNKLCQTFAPIFKLTFLLILKHNRFIIFKF